MCETVREICASDRLRMPRTCLSVTWDRRCKHQIKSPEELWSSFGTRLFLSRSYEKETRDSAGVSKGASAYVLKQQSFVHVLLFLYLILLWIFYIFHVSALALFLQQYLFSIYSVDTFERSFILFIKIKMLFDKYFLTQAFLSRSFAPRVIRGAYWLYVVKRVCIISHKVRHI